LNIENIQFQSIFVLNTLEKLLSGQPILIDKTNFLLFRNVFESLGNNDFKLFFGDRPPDSQQDFCLSIHSLKNLTSTMLEKELSCSFDSSSLSIPSGLVHLFWNSMIHFPMKIEAIRFTKKQIIHCIGILDQLIQGSICKINSEEKSFLQYISIHQNLLNDLS
jgi:hypothetical protein